MTVILNPPRRAKNPGPGRTRGHSNEEKMKMRSALRIVFLAGLAGILPAAAQQSAPPKTTPTPPAKSERPARDPGLYMTFDTSMGAIHCLLYENEAPVTVRTMVRLALGKMSYIDPKTKQTVAGKHFFDGLTFHRVIPQFMIQGGDPLGNGQGGPLGPGFPYKNETSTRLKFDIPGRLAMANAGPDTNASQFFITEVPYPSLNGGYTIWGQCEDLNVVKAITHVPTGRRARDMPNTPVLIKQVTVERVGRVPANAPEGGPAKTGTAPAKKATTKAPEKKSS